MISLLGYTFDWETAIKLLAVATGVVAGSLVAASLIERAVRLWATRRGLSEESHGLPAMRRFLRPVLLVAALQLVFPALELPRALHLMVGRLLSVANLALVLYLVSSVVLALLRQTTERSAAAQRTAPQVLTISRVVLTIVSVTILLDNLGVRVTALMTTLGIGSAAVALALQDTLSNFFASIYLHADAPLRVGDFIRLDTGEQGTVAEIGWRSTRLKTAIDTTVIVPNERLLRVVVQNYSLPEPEVAFEVRVTVPYTADVDQVEKLLLAAVSGARRRAPGILDAPPPMVRLVPGFSENGLQLTVTARVGSADQRTDAEDAVRREVVRMFREDAIEIRRG